MDNRDIGNRICNSMPRIGREISVAFPPLLWSLAAVGASALTLTAFGIWYVFELAYVEKKASKHKRRHRRRKHTIPWHKIKIVGPVLGCGANRWGGVPAGTHIWISPSCFAVLDVTDVSHPTRLSCSLNHGAAKGGASSGGKCPMGFVAPKDKAV